MHYTSQIYIVLSVLTYLSAVFILEMHFILPELATLPSISKLQAPSHHLVLVQSVTSTLPIQEINNTVQSPDLTNPA
jgi:hypothetical protein